MIIPVCFRHKEKGYFYSDETLKNTLVRCNCCDIEDKTQFDEFEAKLAFEEALQNDPLTY